MLAALEFKAEGIGESEQAARTEALEAILAQMGEGLGYTLSTEYLRELTTTGRIEQFEAYISNIEIVAGEEVHCFVSVLVPADSYYSNRSDEYIKMLEREDDIRALIAEAEEHYRNNRDSEALYSMLEALDLSLSGGISDPSLSPETLRDKAIGYLGNMEIRASAGDVFSITVYRRKGIFHPRVDRCTVEMLYARLNSSGIAVRDTLSVLTDQKGNCEFVQTDPYALRYGELVFRVDLPDDTLQAIGSKAGDGFLDPLLEVWDSRSVRIIYNGAADISKVIAFAAYRADGSLIENSSAYFEFRKYIEHIGLSVELVPAAGEDADEMLGTLSALYPEGTEFIIARVGAVDAHEILNGWIARAEAYVLYPDGEIQSSAAVAEGDDYELAVTAALDKAARIAAGMMLKRL